MTVGPLAWPAQLSCGGFGHTRVPRVALRASGQPGSDCQRTPPSSPPRAAWLTPDRHMRAPGLVCVICASLSHASFTSCCLAWHARRSHPARMFRLSDPGRRWRDTYGSRWDVSFMRTGSRCERCPVRCSAHASRCSESGVFRVYFILYQGG